MEWERQKTYLREEGFAEGAQNAKLETAKIALKNNISLEMIQTLTGLSLTEVNQLKSTIEN